MELDVVEHLHFTLRVLSPAEEKYQLKSLDTEMRLLRQQMPCRAQMMLLLVLTITIDTGNWLNPWRLRNCMVLLVSSLERSVRGALCRSWHLAQQEDLFSCQGCFFKAQITC
uniref:Uncharacterized protein n=1 Tax=Opuntia streptacantha TaxID=393608 RepID=A0A7C8ZSF0_OPUST